MHEFDYVAPSKLEEALDIVSGAAGNVRLLAGGTDLIVNMRVGRHVPGLVVDTKKIDVLNEITIGKSAIEIGASVSCRRIWEHDHIHTYFPALIDCCSLIGSVQVQGRASIGGNLCNASPSADTIPTLIALGAVAQVQSVEGIREVPVEEFCVAPGKTVLGDREILVKISIPNLPEHSGARFLRFIPRNEMDIAVVNAAASITLESSRERFGSAERKFKKVRLALGAVGPTPIFAEQVGSYLAGQPASDESIAAAAAFAKSQVSPIDDMRGTAEHRLQLVEVLTKRVIHGAIKRVEGER